MKKSKTGTREWSDVSYNIGTGCSHWCRYCYARAQAIRYKIATAESWNTERLKREWKVYLESSDFISGATPCRSMPNDKRVMFPTTHDITPFYLEASVKAIRFLIARGNHVLIVSKPHLECIQRLCRELSTWRDHILFRFSIGTDDDRLRAFWEPGAPSIHEREACLQHAFDLRFQTSVSMEPMLSDRCDTIRAFHRWKPFVTEKVWIGKMNGINSRVDQSDPAVAQACREMQRVQSDEEIRLLYQLLQDQPKVEWKDSIRKVIER